MMNMKHWIWFLILIPKMNKAGHYQRYADYIATQAVSTGFCWMDFLDTMARNSKRSIPELLLIHLQRPEATDCRTYQEWMESGYRVRRGSIGIAVPDFENPEKMRYLFDREDTTSTPSAQKAWKLYSDLEDDVVRALEDAFGNTGTKDFRQMVDHAVNLALDDYWAVHDKEVIDSIMDCMKGWGDCCCGQHWEVRLCARTDCPLYPYRMGSRPKTKGLLARMNDENDDSNSTE